MNSSKKQKIKAYCKFLKSRGIPRQRTTVKAIHTIVKFLHKSNKKIQWSKKFYPKELLLDFSNLSSNIYSKWVHGKRYMENKGFKLYEPYQTKALYWFLKREINPKYKHGGIIADEMGLGKTIQSLSIIAANPTKLPTIIVLPISLIQQWLKFIKILFPKFVIYIHHGPTRKTTTQDILNLKPDIVLTSHGLLSKRNRLQKKIFIPTVLHQITWSRIIIDEAHYIRNFSSLKTQGVMALKAQNRWALTGTPIQNKINDIYTLFRFIGFKLSQLKDPQLFQKIKLKYLLRRTKKQLQNFNPTLALQPPTINDVLLKFHTNKEKKFYTKVKNNTTKEFHKILASNIDKKTQMVLIFELLLRLRQATITPQLVLNGYTKKGLFKISYRWNTLSTKFFQLLQDITSLQHTHPDDHIIIFTQFTHEIDAIYTLLRQTISSIDKIDGRTSTSDRHHILLHPPHILLIQIKAGSVGLNLQHYNRVFFTAPHWNPATQLQAIARAHRLGQTKHVTVTRYFLENTIDQYIQTLQHNKLQLLHNTLTTTSP